MISAASIYVHSVRRLVVEFPRIGEVIEVRNAERANMLMQEGAVLLAVAHGRSFETDGEHAYLVYCLGWVDRDDNGVPLEQAGK